MYQGRHAPLYVCNTFFVVGTPFKNDKERKKKAALNSTSAGDVKPLVLMGNYCSYKPLIAEQ